MLAIERDQKIGAYTIALPQSLSLTKIQQESAYANKFKIIYVLMPNVRGGAQRNNFSENRYLKQSENLMHVVSAGARTLQKIRDFCALELSVNARAFRSAFTFIEREINDGHFTIIVLFFPLAF